MFETNATNMATPDATANAAVGAIRRTPPAAAVPGRVSVSAVQPESRRRRLLRSSMILSIAASLMLSAGCSRTGVYYKALEKIGIEKRDVLARLNDQVLFLKHNLNARVLGSLQGTADNLQLDVSRLIQDMESSISEATILNSR